MSGGLGFFGIVAFIVLVAILKTAVIVPQKTAYIVERLGRYRCTLDASGTVLVYGWQMIAHQVSGSTAMLLFVPSRQVEDLTGINQLRLLSGKTDKRFTLPTSCVGAALYNQKIYAFSHEMIYRAEANAQRFTPISLPAEVGGARVTGFLGMLKNGVALLSCDSDVYAVTLP